MRDKARVFKVLKQPVPLDRTPPELRAILGYEFFSTDPETGKVHELDEVFGPEAQRDFWLRLDDLAHDLVALLEAIEEDAQLAPFVPDEMQQNVSANASGRRRTQPRSVSARRRPAARAPASKATVYLAETTSDVREQREALRRDLQQQGFRVAPRATDPARAETTRIAAIREDLAQSRLAVHLLGRHYGVVPEGATHSIAEMQYELSSERAGQARFSRLLWIPPGPAGRRCRARRRCSMRCASIRASARTPTCSRHRSRICARRSSTGSRAMRRHRRLGRCRHRQRSQVYFIADQRDAERLAPWSDALFGEHLEIIHPIFEGDEAEIREFHEETLSTCDACVIFYGSGNELWLRRKLREIQKSPGYGRTKPLPLVCVAQIASALAGEGSFPLARGDRRRAVGRRRPGRPASLHHATEGRPLCLIRFPGSGPSRPTRNICSSAAKTRSTNCCASSAPRVSSPSSARREAASRRSCAPG